jgi:hypothetical protein
MDSQTDSSTTDTMGRIEGQVECAVAYSFKTDVTGAIRRYMAIKDDSGYTFHRFYLGITHMNLKPGVTGVGYKAVFYGDEQVTALIESYGYTLWVGNGEKLTAGKDGAFVSGKVLTLRLQNFDVENYGEESINGSVFLKLKDGTVIESNDYTYTLKAMLETIAANADSYTQEQLEAVKAMVRRNAEAMADWNIDALR